MDTRVLYAIDALFIVAVIAPSLLVIVYRIRDVPLRSAEIDDMLKAAFQNPDEAARKAAHEALENNPFISDPKKTFAHCHHPWRYVLPLVVLIILTVSSAYVVYSWVYYRLVPPLSAPVTSATGAAPSAPASGTPPTPPAQLAVPTAPAAAAPNAAETSLPIREPIPARLPLVIIMALAGGYVWSVYQIFARIRASELSPSDLYEIDLGVLASIPVGFAFSLITAELDGVRSFMAFAASAFPLREVSRLVRQNTTRKMLESTDASTTRPTELHLGTAIEGLSDQTLARLSELRITTVLDMAYCDPIKVMVQTGFPLPVIVDWIDQSLWALYVGDLKAQFDKCGLRCSLDVCEFVDLHLLDGEGKKKAVISGTDKEALDALAQKMCAPVLLQDLFFRIYVDAQVIVLRKLWYPKGVPKELHA
jgi:hypothetical protein